MFREAAPCLSGNRRSSFLIRLSGAVKSGQNSYVGRTLFCSAKLLGVRGDALGFFGQAAELTLAFSFTFFKRHAGEECVVV